MLQHTSKHFEPRFCEKGKRELEPKVEIFCLINASISCPAKQNGAIQEFIDGDQGVKLPVAGRFFFIF